MVRFSKFVHWFVIHGFSEPISITLIRSLRSRRDGVDAEIIDSRDGWARPPAASPIAADHGRVDIRDPQVSSKSGQDRNWPSHRPNTDLVYSALG